MPDDDFIDPFDDTDAPVERPKTTRAGGFTETVVELTLSLTPFGLPYSSIKIGGTFTHAAPVSEDEHLATIKEQAGTVAHELGTHLGSAIAAQVQAIVPELPATPAGAYASQAPLTAPQAPQQLPQAPAGVAGMQAVVNGQASPSATFADMVTVSGQYGDVTFVTTQALDSRTFEAQAAAAFCAEFQVHPSMIRVFDNRPYAEKGERIGHAGRVAIANAAPEFVKQTFGKKSAAWVDFHRDGSIKVSATKDFKEMRDLNVLNALAQGVQGQPQARPF